MTRQTRLLALGLAAALLTGAGPTARAHDHGGARASPAATDAAGYPAPRPDQLGGPFSLIDHSGREVSDRTYRGQWMLLYFGFTGCRESCPIALSTLALMLEGMGPEADRLQPLFVDFSMEKPDLKGLGQFVGNFHPRMTGLAGSRKQMFAMLRAFQVRREHQHHNYSGKETGPRIDHTAYVYLVGPDGVTRDYFYYTLTPEEMAARIRQNMLAAKTDRP